MLWDREKRAHKHMLHAIAMAVVFVLGFSMIASSRAAVNYMASGLLGQFGLIPVYGPHTSTYATTDADDGEAGPNDYGFNNPGDLALDVVHHRLFVSDTVNNRILVFNLDTDNHINDYQADFVLGQPDFTTTSWTRASHPENSFGYGSAYHKIPIAYNPANDLLFVADSTDYYKKRILVFDVSSITNGQAASKAIGNFVTSLDDTTFSGWNMSSFLSLSVDPSFGLLYASVGVEDYINYHSAEVQVFDISGGLAGITNGQQPVHYLEADGESANAMEDCSYQMSPDGHNFCPGGLAAVPGHGLFVADWLYNRVLYFDFSAGVGSITDYMDASNVLGAPDLYTPGAGSYGNLNTDIVGLGALQNISYDSKNDTGNLYVSIGSGVLVYHIKGTVVDYMQNLSGDCSDVCSGPNIYPPFYGSDLWYYTGDNYLLAGDAIGVAGSPDGTVFIADTGRNRVTQFESLDSYSNGYSLYPQPTGVLGQTDVSVSYEWDTTTPIYTQSDQYSGAADPNEVGLYQPYDIAVDTVHHRLFVSDHASSSIHVFNLDSYNNLLDNVADVALGQASFSANDHTVNHFQLSSQGLIAYDTVDDRLFVADVGHNRVGVWDTSVLSNGGLSFKNVLGKPDLYSEGEPTSVNASEIDIPSAIAYDSVHKRLFVADSNVNENGHSFVRILVYDLSGGLNWYETKDADYVLGQSSLTSGDYEIPGISDTPTASGFGNVGSLEYDSNNNRLYVGDSTNSRVLVFDVSDIHNGEDASYVIGAPDFTTAGTLIDLNGITLDGTSTTLFISRGFYGVYAYNISDMEVGAQEVGQFASDGGPNQYQTAVVYNTGFDDLNQRLYVSDLGNNRVLYFNLIQINPVTPTTYSAEVGQPFSTTPATTNAQGDVTFGLVSGTGAPPDGITFSSSISGTPTTAGTYTFKIRAQDNIDTNNYIPSAPFEVTVNVAPAPGGGSTGTSTSGSGSTGVVLPPSSTTSGTGVSGSTTASGTTGTTTGGSGTASSATGGSSSSGNNGSSSASGNVTGNSSSVSGDTYEVGMGGGTGDIGDSDTSGGTSSSTTADAGVDTSGNLGSSSGADSSFVDECPGNIFNQVVCNVMDSYDYTAGVLGDTLHQVRGYMAMPTGDVISKSIGIVGIIAGTLFTLLPVLFANPISFSELFLLPARLWSLLLVAFGLKKRNRPWGRVYDSVTKQPLDPVYVSLQDNEGKEVANCITDIDGRYGFLVEPGKYRMIPQKTHYSFPSAKLIGKTRDELYLDLYFGYIFEVKKAGEVITKNIPMDPDTFDWNEFAKQERTLMRFYSKRDRVWARISDVAFSIGLTVATVALVTAPTKYNIIIFALYILMLVVKEVGFRQRSAGVVVRKGTDIPVPFAILRIISAKTGVEVLHKVTNILGKYYALASNGTYNVTIETKNQDGSYTMAMKKEGVVISNGILKEKFEV